MRKLLKYITFLSFIILLLTGCEKDKQQEYEVSYLSKCAYQNFEQKWKASFCLSFPMKDVKKQDSNDNYEFNANTTYTFDGYSFDYLLNRQSYIPILDETGNIIKKLPTAIATFSTFPAYHEEAIKITDYFNQKKFSKKISEVDLNDLNINYFSKNLLVNLFNQAIQNTVTKKGKYFKIPASFKAEKIIDNNTLSISYLLDYGNISDIHIELVSSDHSYLTNKIENKIATEEEIHLYNQLTKIKQSILNQNSFQIEDLYPEMDSAIKEAIFAILEDFENGNTQDTVTTDS